MSTVVEGIGRLLAADGVGAYAGPAEVLPTGQTPITVADMTPDGDLAICLNTYPGGPEPDARNQWEYPRLQVRTRGRNPLDALALDREVYELLQARADNLPGTTFYLQDCYALQSEAQPLGADANGRHEYVRNYQLSVEPAS